jgi:hypothetical protein
VRREIRDEGAVANAKVQHRKIIWELCVCKFKRPDRVFECVDVFCMCVSVFKLKLRRRRNEEEQESAYIV